MKAPACTCRARARGELGRLLQTNAALVSSPQHRALVAGLAANGQGHLFRHWAPAGGPFRPIVARGASGSPTGSCRGACCGAALCRLLCGRCCVAIPSSVVAAWQAYLLPPNRELERAAPCRAGVNDDAKQRVLTTTAAAIQQAVQQPEVEAARLGGWRSICTARQCPAALPCVCDAVRPKSKLKPRRS